MRMPRAMMQPWAASLESAGPLKAAPGSRCTWPLLQEHDVKEAEAAEAKQGAVRGKGKESLSNDDLARLIVVKPVSHHPDGSRALCRASPCRRGNRREGACCTHAERAAAAACLPRAPSLVGLLPWALPIHYPALPTPTLSRPAPAPLQSQRSPLKPKMDDGDDMAAVINDGLELYARQLQQVGASAHRRAAVRKRGRRPALRGGTARHVVHGMLQHKGG